MEGGACIMGINVAQAEKEHELLRIIFNAPFILERLFETGKLGEDAKHRYMWGTISAEDVEKVKEFFADGKRD